jgi:hypothetical protein
MMAALPNQVPVPLQWKYKTPNLDSFEVEDYLRLTLQKSGFIYVHAVDRNAYLAMVSASLHAVLMM